MPVESAAPAHIASVDQVYVICSGQGAFTLDGQSTIAGPGDTIILPAGATRQVACTGAEPMVALVATEALGRITMPDGTDRGTLDWAR